MSIPKAEARIEKFEEMGFGMFVHWGLYSQLGVGEWAKCLKAIQMDEYAKLMDNFTAKDFDANSLVKIAKRAGMKYIVLTTRHHEGFSLYDTRGLCDFDSVHSPAGRDLVKEFVEACRKENIIPFFYHTTLDWYQDSYKSDFDTYLEYLRKSVEVLCTNYGEIGGLWFDGNWNKPEADWKLDELYGTIRKHQPNAMIINNTGIKKRGKLGHPEIDSVTFEQGRPEAMNREGMPKYISAEMCQTMNEHWGVGKNDMKYKSTKELIENLCACRKVGANYLLNVGPTADGKVLKMQEALLEVLGEWMDIYGKAIYEGRPCNIKGLEQDFALETKDGKIYLMIFDLSISGHSDVTVAGKGSGERVFTGIERKLTSIKWVDNGEELKYTQDNGKGILSFDATGYPYGEDHVVRVAEIEYSS